MRIVYLHQYFNTPEQSGSTRSYEFARRLAARGHDVHVVTSDRGDERSPGWTQESVEGFTVHRRHVAYNNEMSPLRRIRAFTSFAAGSASRARRLKGDLVFATSTPLTIFLPAWYAVALRKTPLVFEVRDSWPTVPIALGYLTNPIAQRVARRLERKAYRRSARIIALSPGMAEDACEHGATGAQLTVIPNAADTDLFAVDRSVGLTWRTANNIAVEAPLIVYTGTFGAANDVEYLIHVAAEASKVDPTAVFALIGTGGREDAIRELAQRLGVLGTTIRLLPPVPKREVPAVLSAADITTSVVTDNPAMNANSANKFFDSLAAGRPIAINHEGWQADLIRDREVGLVLERDDYAAAAKQLLALSKDPNRLAATGKNARALAIREFSRDDLAGRLAEIIEDLA